MPYQITFQAHVSDALYVPYPDLLCIGYGSKKLPEHHSDDKFQPLLPDLPVSAPAVQSEYIPCLSAQKSPHNSYSYAQALHRTSECPVRPDHRSPLPELRSQQLHNRKYPDQGWCLTWRLPVQHCPLHKLHSLLYRCHLRYSEAYLCKQMPFLLPWYHCLHSQ